MRLWTVQPRELYKKLKAEKVLHCDPVLSELVTECGFGPAYDWLAEQMKTCVRPPPKGIIYPFWAWHTIDWRHQKPDLRRTEFRAYKGDQVCLELEIPDNMVLLSNEDAWHIVLNNAYYGDCANEQEMEKEDAWFDSLPPKEQTAVKTKSGDRMTLSNKTYWVNITKVGYPLRSLEAEAYDHVFNPCGYKENNFHSAFVIKIKTAGRENIVALIGSFYANAEHCATLDGSDLTVLMDDEIVLFDLDAVSILKHKTVGDETYFSIYPVSGGYLIHGELSILRIDNSYARVWDFSGLDIWVVQDNTREAFKIIGDRIFLEDWNGIKYTLDMDGNLLADTFNE